MLEKLKSLGAGAKQVLLYIIAPLLGLLGYIYYLLQKNRSLRDDIVIQKIDKELSEAINKKEEAKNEANQAETDYLTLRNDIIKQFLSGSKSDPDAK